MNNKLNSGALTGRFSTKTSFIQLFSANRGRMRGRAGTEWNLKTSCVIMIVRTRLVLRLIIYMTGHGKTGDGAATGPGAEPALCSSSSAEQ